MAKALPSPQDAANNWKTGFSGAGSKWAAAIGRVDRAPGLDAAAAVDRYVMGVQASAPKFARNVAAVTKEAWQASAQASQGNLARGATKGFDKYQAKIGNVLQAIGQVRGSLPPRGDIEANIQRSAAFQRGMHNAFNG